MTGRFAAAPDVNTRTSCDRRGDCWAICEIRVIRG
jgi:hypothetical protein